jgi:hypothetical protein
LLEVLPNQREVYIQQRRREVIAGITVSLGASCICSMVLSLR